MGGTGGAAAAAPGKQGAAAGDPRAEALRCPRCDSANTKFCYYNNYSLAQPRHFCKACKRYWTRGGTLRNVPVGGGCRKNKRASRAGKHPASSAPAASAAAAGGPPPGPVLFPASGSAALASFLLANADLNLFHGGGGFHSLAGAECSFDLQPPQAAAQGDVLGLGYAGGGLHLPESYLPPFLAGSLVPGLDELQLKPEAGEQPPPDHWPPQPNMAAAPAAISSDALMTAATAPAGGGAAAFMYWNAAGIGGAAWPDMANCGSSVAPLF